MTVPRAILIDQPGEPLALRVIGPGLDHMVPLTDATLARLLSDVARAASRRMGHHQGAAFEKQSSEIKARPDAETGFNLEHDTMTNDDKPNPVKVMQGRYGEMVAAVQSTALPADPQPEGEAKRPAVAKPVVGRFGEMTDLPPGAVFI